MKPADVFDPEQSNGDKQKIEEIEVNVLEICQPGNRKIFRPIDETVCDKKYYAYYMGRESLAYMRQQNSAIESELSRIQNVDVYAPTYVELPEDNVFMRQYVQVMTEFCHALVQDPCNDVIRQQQLQYTVEFSKQLSGDREKTLQQLKELRREMETKSQALQAQINKADAVQKERLGLVVKQESANYKKRIDDLMVRLERLSGSLELKIALLEKEVGDLKLQIQTLQIVSGNENKGSTLLEVRVKQLEEEVRVLRSAPALELNVNDCERGEK